MIPPGSRIEIFAPAKINLFLHIIGKRPDGFHELETLMAPISLGDTLTVAAVAASGLELTCSIPGLSSGSDNLVHRAVTAYTEAFGPVGGLKIHLEKRIPVGAGLGGGSADAAATLLALRSLTGARLTDAELEKIAARLGSDIPFFIQSKPALCRGRGEMMEPFTLPEQLPALLIHPGFGVSTPWAYQSYAQNPQRGKIGQSFSFGTLRNDLEPPVFTKYLWLPRAKQWLRQRPETRDALMSGSGSSLFALLHDGADATALGQAFQNEFGTTISVWPIRIN